MILRRAAMLLALTVVIGGCTTPPRDIDWQWGAVMPEARSARATAVAAGRIVTVGGTSWPEVDGQKQKQWHQTVHAFSTDDGTWSSLPDYPLQTGYAAAFGMQNRLLVIGGRHATKAHRETFFVDVTAPALPWKQGPALPQPLFGLVGGVIGQTVFVTGGFQPDGSGGHRPGTSVLALDTSCHDAAWRQVAVLPRADLEWPMAVTARGKLFVFGGSGSGVPLRSVWAFDPATASWDACRPMPISLSSGAATAVDDRHVLICGGATLAVTADSTPDGKPRTPIASTCLLYDTWHDRYTFMTPLPQAVLDQGLVVIDHKIYSLGGEESPHRTRTDLMQVGRLQ